MRFLRNLVLASCLALSAQAVEITWIEYDPGKKAFIATIEYVGSPDQEFELVFEDGEHGLVGEIVETSDDDTESSKQAGKKHLKKWQRKKLAALAEFERRERSRAARALREETQNNTREIELPFEHGGGAVFFHIHIDGNFILTEVIAGADDPEVLVAAPRANATLALPTPADAAAAPPPAAAARIPVAGHGSNFAAH